MQLRFRRGFHSLRNEKQDTEKGRRKPSWNVFSVPSAYLDTSVLGHWILYHSQSRNMTELPPSARSSLELLRLVRNGRLDCKLETTDFALTELSQVVRDNLLASKMMRDAQSLVYFQSLKSYYKLDDDEQEDFITYFREFNILLRELKIVGKRMKIMETRTSATAIVLGVDVPDGLHLNWANRQRCKYFVTTDSRLLELIRDENPFMGKMWVINPGQLPQVLSAEKEKNKKTKTKRK